MLIGDYTCKTPFVTAGSGNARWCVAQKNKKQYFLKQFLAPVQPVQTTLTPTRQVLLRRRNCAAFETRKIKLYDTLKRVSANHIVQAEDFFVHDGHYYAASLYLGDHYQTFDDYFTADRQIKRMLLLSLSGCLQALHRVGVVHADLKPEHIVVESDQDHLRVRLIDFDSSFLEAAPPESGNALEIDPVYLSPEAYRMISGRNVRLNRKIDTFAFGLLAHQMLAGALPEYDKNHYSYPYASVLDGQALIFSDTVEADLQHLISKMLKKRPAFRPEDNRIAKQLQALLR